MLCTVIHTTTIIGVPDEELKTILADDHVQSAVFVGAVRFVSGVDDRLVFGGMGSLTGSIVSAIGLTILPELLRAFADYYI